MATGHMDFGKDSEKIDYHVRVTFEDKDEPAAREWWNIHRQQLDR